MVHLVLRDCLPLARQDNYRRYVILRLIGVLKADLVVVMEEYVVVHHINLCIEGVTRGRAKE
jgi:hypothetical protein